MATGVVAEVLIASSWSGFCSLAGPGPGGGRARLRCVALAGLVWKRCGKPSWRGGATLRPAAGSCSNGPSDSAADLGLGRQIQMHAARSGMGGLWRSNAPGGAASGSAWCGADLSGGSVPVPPIPVADGTAYGRQTERSNGKRRRRSTLRTPHRGVAHGAECSPGSCRSPTTLASRYDASDCGLGRQSLPPQESAGPSGLGRCCLQCWRGAPAYGRMAEGGDSQYSSWQPLHAL